MHSKQKCECCQTLHFNGESCPTWKRRGAVPVERRCPFLSFVPPCFVDSSEGRKEGVHHLLRSFLRLRSFFVFIFFLACELRGDVELFWQPSFVVLDAPALANALLLLSSRVACVSKHSQNKNTTKSWCWMKRIRTFELW